MCQEIQWPYRHGQAIRFSVLLQLLWLNVQGVVCESRSVHLVQMLVNFPTGWLGIHACMKATVGLLQREYPAETVPKYLEIESKPTKARPTHDVLVSEVLESLLARVPRV